VSLMAYVLFVLLLLLISKGATATVDHQCPAAASGSGIAEYEQVITVDYCVVDDYTVQRTDTGEQLDIVYANDSLLVVTTIGNLNYK